MLETGLAGPVFFTSWHYDAALQLQQEQRHAVTTGRMQAALIYSGR